MKSRFRVVCVAFCFGVIGCGMSTPEYSIAVRNATGKEIDHAEVRFGEFRDKFGVLIIGATATHAGMQEPIPEVAVLQWQDEQGKWHRSEARVKRALPKGFRDDEIIFEIRPGNIVVVTVEPRPGRGVIVISRTPSAR